MVKPIQTSNFKFIKKMLRILSYSKHCILLIIDICLFLFLDCEKENLIDEGQSETFIFNDLRHAYPSIAQKFNRKFGNK